jgi:hypothetical protein
MCFHNRRYCTEKAIHICRASLQALRFDGDELTRNIMIVDKLTTCIFADEFQSELIVQPFYGIGDRDPFFESVI